MKILHVTNFFKPLWEAGGVVRSVYEMTKTLHECGHSVTVFTTNRFISEVPETIQKFDVVDGLNVYYFKNYLTKFTLNTFPLPLFAFLKIRKEIQNFNIIHIHEHRSLLALFASHYAQKKDIPYIIQSHGSVMAINNREIIKKIFDTFCGNNILWNATAVIALSESEEKQYLEMGVQQSRIFIIPNGINVDDFTTLPKFGLFRKKNRIQESQKVILFLGRLNWIKGVDLLIDAFCDINKKIPDSTLIIAGPDDGILCQIKNQIKTLRLENKVIITGPIYENEKLCAYVDADVFVLPSRYETFPMTVLESSLCNTPVVVTQNCGIANIIENNLGFVSSINSEDLSKSIITILTDSNKQVHFKKISREFVQKNFDISIISSKM
ncbi:MAG: glycosyltransferase, partial [Methanobacterium sp.]